MDKTFLRADDMIRDSFLLARKIVDSGFIPTVLAGLWRGGTPIGITIHEFLAYKGVTTWHTAFKATSYVGIANRADTVIEAMEPLLANVTGNSRVLIVDDIFDSGKTLEKVVDVLRPRVDDLRIATLYYKPSASKVSLVPDYYLHKTDRWIVFPHELAGLTMDEIRAKDSVIADLLA